MLVGKADTVVVSRARTLLIDLIAPVMDAASRPIASAKEAANSVQELIALKQENARLAEENQTLLEWQSIGRELQSQNAALRDLLKFTPDPRSSYIAAPVIADTSSSYVRSLIVLAGEGDGVIKGQAAITGAGLVGRVLEVGRRASRVLLLTDISARVPVVIERTRDQAVLAGNNSDNPELQYLPRDVDIKVGDRIVTSGVGGNFPVGLPVGEVTRVADGHILVQLYAQLERMEYLRLVDYSLPGILLQDLGVDASKADVTSPALGKLPRAQ
jgi:rod shape-determining protein MreC